MKKREFKSLAILGLTSGLLLTQEAVMADPDENQQSLLAMMADHACSTTKMNCNTMADHKCKGKGGCGTLMFDHTCTGKQGCKGLTAERDQPDEDTNPYQSPSDYDPDAENSDYKDDLMMKEKRSNAMNGE